MLFFLSTSFNLTFYINVFIYRCYLTLIGVHVTTYCTSVERIFHLSWLWKYLKMVVRGGEFRFFWRYSCKNWYKIWYLHFDKAYDHQILQLNTSRVADSNETDQADARYVTMSKSLEFERCYNFLSARVYDHQISTK